MTDPDGPSTDEGRRPVSRPSRGQRPSNWRTSDPEWRSPLDPPPPAPEPHWRDPDDGDVEWTQAEWDEAQWGETEPDEVEWAEAEPDEADWHEADWDEVEPGSTSGQDGADPETIVRLRPEPPPVRRRRRPPRNYDRMPRTIGEAVQRLWVVGLFAVVSVVVLVIVSGPGDLSIVRRLFIWFSTLVFGVYLLREHRYRLRVGQRRLIFLVCSTALIVLFLVLTISAF